MNYIVRTIKGLAPNWQLPLYASQEVEIVTLNECRLFCFGYTVDIDSNFHFHKRVGVMSVFIVYSCLLGLYFICRCSGQRYSYNDVSLFCIEN